MNLMESKAEPMVYDFFDSAQRSHDGIGQRIGVHLSMHRPNGEIINAFFDYEQALRMRDALVEIAPKLVEANIEKHRAHMREINR